MTNGLTPLQKDALRDLAAGDLVRSGRIWLPLKDNHPGWHGFGVLQVLEARGYAFVDREGGRCRITEEGRKVAARSP